MRLCKAIPYRNKIKYNVQLVFHTENGALGFGPRPKANESDSDIGNAGGEPVKVERYARDARLMDIGVGASEVLKWFWGSTACSRQ
ncbi:hypothetical protein Ga0466249_001198 [Sporomusaceae bacterium BoRhaA]|uniref:hypothetical protein n=1 Tax=Pelorhabdus rhamnosifermentans TaxID=2772457 RepID=UPI001C0614E0|nr:hypothetical protein [Pelorhabdus rhamnosifermentans]MBU2700106.1 hypothetical protein [Pelorhabdus rhamnosifermentans]